jgi:spoIIIJ-associated protein
MASIEVTASDVESAITQGLAKLQLMRTDVKIEIVEEGSKGVLGLGAKPARVRLTPFDDLEAAAAPARSVAPATTATAAAAATDDDADDAGDDEDFDDEADDDEEDFDDDQDGDDAADSDGDGDDPDADDEDDAGTPMIEGEPLAVEIASTILQNMGFKRAECNGRSVLPMDDADQPSIVIDIQVDERDEEAFLSHNAEALSAMQTLVQTMWSHKTKSSVRVNLDVNGYKAERQERLMGMARRMAERVVTSGKPITLEPMPAIDRRIVHMALRENPDVFTESVGEGQSRKVQIKPKQGEA